MSRKRLFIENFLVYGLGNVLSKVISLIFLPIVTRLIPDTTYYGIADLSSVVVSFFSTIILMGMYDAMFRMFFEKEEEEYKKKVCSNAIFVVLVNSLAVALLFYILKVHLAKIFFGDEMFVNILNITNLTIIISSLGSVIKAPTRMLNKQKIFVAANLVSSLMGYSIAIPLLLRKNYLYALPLSTLISSSALLLSFLMLNRKWFDLRQIDKKLIIELLKIGIPLVPTFIIYWIFSSTDRIMISKIIGNDYVGIYGVGARVASISQFIYVAFASGWQYFAFSTMKDKDYVKVLSQTFEYLGIISFNVFLVLMPFSQKIFEILFTGDYVKAFVVFPYLFLSPLLLMLFQVSSTQFLVIKKTIYVSSLLFLGAIMNILFNFIFIKTLGIEGAAIATVLGYSFSTVITIMFLERQKLIIIPKRFLIVTLTTITYTLLWRMFLMKNLFFSVVFLILSLFFVNKFYMNDIKLHFGDALIFLKKRINRRDL